MNWSEHRDKISAALVAFHGEVTNPPKNAVNPHFRSRYTSLDCVLDHLRPIAAKHGLAFTQAVESAPDGVAITTTVVHTSGQWRESVSVYTPDKAGVQAAGSAITYGRRYDLLAAAGVAGDPDDDGESATDHAPSARTEQLRDAIPPRDKPAPAGVDLAKFTLPKMQMLGDSVGRPIAQADTRHLERFRDFLGGKLDDPRWGARNRSLVSAIEDELARRGEGADDAPTNKDDDLPF